jgi:hypothetical protein
VARVLLGDKWFDEVSPRSLYEADYHEILKRISEQIFPDFVLVKFTQRVTSPYGNADPDFALVSRQYKSWWVVEAEMADHSLRGHVIPQVRTFQFGRYQAQHIDALMAARREFDKRRLEPLVLYTPPRVLVIVNRPMPDWTRVLEHLEAAVSVVEVFRSRDNNFAFRVNGDTPTDVDIVESPVRWDDRLPRLLKVTNPAALLDALAEFVTIYLEGAATTWRVQRLGDGIYLVPLGRFPLEASKKYVIRRYGDRLELASPGED